MRTPLRLRLVLVTTLLASGGVLAVPAHAATTTEYTALRFVYTKNGCVATGCATNAELKYVYNEQVFVDGIPKPTVQHEVSWRAGSGAPGGTNACTPNVGWIPNTDIAGTSQYDNDYYVVLSDPNNGSDIFGTAWQIHNHLYGGAIQANCDTDAAYERDDILIHSEMTNDHQQTNCSGTGDSPTCWEGPSDYYSLGCIKVSFANIWGTATVGGTADSGTVKWYWVHRGGKNGIPLIVRS